MKKGSERRGSNRRHDRLTFVFHYLQRHVKLETIDLSLDGAMLESPIVFPSGTLMVLEYFGGQPGDQGIRLLARVMRVTRSYRGYSSSCGLGVNWLRAYTLGPRAHLHEFLIESLGYPESVMDGCVTTSAGLTSVTLHSVETAPSPAAAEDRSKEAGLKMSRFGTMQKGRFRLDLPVTYSMGNMHYRGNVVSVGSSGVGLVSQGSLPFATAKVVVRFPLGDAHDSPKVLLFTEVEMVAEPSSPGGAGAFSARIYGIDELDAPGGFKAFLKQASAKMSVWP